MNVGLDLNLVVLCGRLASDPEQRFFDSGSRLIRYLVVTRADHPRRRLDVVPVTFWDPPDDLWAEPGEKEMRLWACGSVQRRFWESPDGRRSRLEVVAESVVVGDVGDLEPVKLNEA
jgi:single-stranded DNA-binding protein